jgi:hypothetical protein
LEGKGAERLLKVALGRLGGRVSTDVVVVMDWGVARFRREACEGPEERPFFLGDWRGGDGEDGGGGETGRFRATW